ncbi:MAG TPA: hypothetical protein VLA36_07580 [Longimicrobiales bacterium]|nr:hypothetical protein [Longimicrobiales bacterium]
MMGMTRRVSRLLAVVFLGIAAPAGAEAQVDELTTLCLLVGTGGGMQRCEEYALTATVVQAGAGLSHADGGAFQGSLSTRSLRFGAKPRVAFSARVAFTRYPVIRPDPVARNGMDWDYSISPSFHGQATVGLFDGFSIGPTVGGLLALDAIGKADLTLFPDSKGFVDRQSTGFGYGARVGLLRESATLPGVNFSATRTHGGDVDYIGGEIGIHLDNVLTTSLRAVVGKEFMIGGIQAGAGWDRYESDGEILFLGPIVTPPPPTPMVDFHTSRLLFFGGWSKTFRVMQVSGEFGWARGFHGVTPHVEEFDPATGSLFGSFSVRLAV